MKTHICLLALVGLAACQGTQNGEEREGDFERMVIIQEDQAGQDIGVEPQDAPKMR